jgi:hypothetical protein
MKAQELRIGNLVNHETGQCKVVGFYGEIFRAENINKIELKSNVFNLQPIPLTEKWLLEFGFEKLNTTMSGCFVFQKGLWRVAIKVNIEETYEWVLWHERISPPTWCLSRFEYVHQLQNLYFALTGEELILNT